MENQEININVWPVAEAKAYSEKHSDNSLEEAWLAGWDYCRMIVQIQTGIKI